MRSQGHAEAIAHDLTGQTTSAPIADWRCINVDRWLHHVKGRHAPGKKRLSSEAKLALLLIANFERAWFTVEYLAGQLERTTSTARAAIAELEGAGLVRRIGQFARHGGQGTNTYLLVDPPHRDSGAPPTEIPVPKQKVIKREGREAAAETPPPRCVPRTLRKVDAVRAESAAALSSKNDCLEREDARQALSALTDRFGPDAGQDARQVLREEQPDERALMLAMTALAATEDVRRLGALFRSLVRRGKDGALDGLAAKVEAQRAHEHRLRLRAEREAAELAARRAQRPPAPPEAAPCAEAEEPPPLDELIADLRLGDAPARPAQPAPSPSLDGLGAPAERARQLVELLERASATHRQRPAWEAELRALIASGVRPDAESEASS